MHGAAHRVIQVYLDFDILRVKYSVKIVRMRVGKGQSDISMVKPFGKNL